MGLFSGIIDSIKDIGSYIADTTVDLFGSVIDMLKPEKEMERPYRGTGEDAYDYEYDAGWYDDMYDDYREWIDTFGS